MINTQVTTNAEYRFEEAKRKAIKQMQCIAQHTDQKEQHNHNLPGANLNASDAKPTPSIDPEVQAEIDEYEKNGACKSCQGLR